MEFSSVQLLSHVQHIATPWTAACQASLSSTNSQSLLRLMSIESVMPSNHFLLSFPFSSYLQSWKDQHQSLFKWVSSLHQVAKVLEFQIQDQSFPVNIWDWFPLGWTGWIFLQSISPLLSVSLWCGGLEMARWPSSLCFHFIRTILYPWWKHPSFKH